MGFRKKKDKLKTGWQARVIRNNEPKKENIKNDQVIANKRRSNIFEKIFKWIIYGILFLAIPRYLKSSKVKGKEIVDDAYQKINSNEFAFIPAGYAMYLFLSFIPIACLFVAIIGPISEHYDIVLRYVILGRIIPGVQTTLPNMATIWKGAGGIIAFILFAVSIIWLASKGYAKFAYSIDALYEHKTPRRMWMYRLKGVVISIILTFGLTLMLLGFTAFMTFLIESSEFGVFPSEITSDFTIKNLELKTEFWLIYYFTIILLLPFFTYIGFLIFFKWAPSFKLKLNHAHPGAMISAIPTSIFILIFGSLASIIPYNKYGPIASFMYIILLMSVMSYFIYTGLIVNASFHKIFINQPTIAKTWFFKNKTKNSFYKKYNTENYSSED
ncbi:YihY/virulence factor BrkB family protein [[Mycoplasma] anseris]|nr:YihY/virulence factor BrkB family protein [[Mycoplasma] anseris]